MFYKKHKIIVCWLLLGITSSWLVAQAGEQTEPIDPVSYTIKSPETVKAGEVFSIDVIFNIQPGWYVYAPIEINIAQGKIPTKISFKESEGLKKIGELELPNKGEFFDIYKGNNIKMSQKFQVKKKILSDEYSITANIVYQTCNDDICYPPVRKEKNILIDVK